MTEKLNQTGKVKWFDTTKGFGFIEKSDGSDIFVHYTGLTGLRGLESDQKVTFDITEGKRGPQATNVKITK